MKKERRILPRFNLIAFGVGVGAGRVRQSTRELIKAYELIKKMEAQGEKRSDVLSALMEKFSERHPDVGIFA